MSQSNQRTAPPLRLGVNIDHVATLRNARGGPHPDPVRAALAAEAAGAEGITAHLREDRRHIRDEDMRRLRAEIGLPLNFEMAATEEMRVLALELKPHAVCLVPERREERTTEGGLEVAGDDNRLTAFIAPLAEAGCRVSMFIEADGRQIEASARIGAPVVELHAGAYADAFLEGDAERVEAERAKLAEGARIAAAAGLEVHAGHGLTFENVGPVAEIPELVELNIGHFLIGEAVFMGLDGAVREMRARMDAARRPRTGS
ncbi:MAG: pyridoxine 5'-phosphate synthase [Pseudomonadota bacterium]